MRASSELILNKDGSIYHLGLLPHELAKHVLLVGDPGRVQVVSRYFDLVEVKRERREFVTHTGFFNGVRISVISTGIGTDNIDIVLNEIDALVSFDFDSREPLPSPPSLKFLRLGTCGAIQPDIEPGTLIRSQYSIGFDSLFSFYDYQPEELKGLSESFQAYLHQKGVDLQFYASSAGTDYGLLQLPNSINGITATLPGFYGPQARMLRLKPRYADFEETLSEFSFDGIRICNIEMESSGLFGLAHLLGHKAETISIALANRRQGTFVSSSNMMEEFIQMVLRQFCQSGS